MEYDSKGTDNWGTMVTSAHVNRWVGFNFNPTPLDLASNSHIRVVGHVYAQGDIGAGNHME
jgi:hypothetical protein